jgi:colicin import membrane protein
VYRLFQQAAWIVMSLALFGPPIAVAQSSGQSFRSLQTLPTPPEVLEANRQYRRGELVAALAGIDAFLIKDYANPRARFLRGLILAELRKVDEAIEVFLTMTKEFPELPEPYNNLGVIYAGRGMYDQARESLVAALRANPDDPVAQENLGDVYVRLAIKAYEQVPTINPSNRTITKKLTLLRELSANGERAKSNGAPSNPP